MRLLLHVGMPKTGTTTLQHTLAQHRDALLAAGVLYPSVESRSANHNGLMAPFLSLAKPLPREFRPPGGVRGAQAHGQLQWDDICRQIARTKPETVILSGEYFFAQSQALLEALRDRLSEQFDELRVIAYVRDPPAYYLSLMQQRLKASSTTEAPASFRARARICLSRHLEVFGARVTVRAFDRESLVEGDIVRDFLMTFVPESATVADRLITTSHNESMSAEAMCIMQEFRRRVWPDQDDVFAPECNHVVALLTAAHDEWHQTPAALRPGIAEVIRRRHRAELEWLEATFGVRFPSAGAPSCDEVPEEPAGCDSTRIIDVIEVEQPQVDGVLYRLLRELCVTEPLTRRGSPTVRPGDGQAPGARRRVRPALARAARPPLRFRFRGR